MVTVDGIPGFSNGRHRFAVLRDCGRKTIPVAAEEVAKIDITQVAELIENASRHGLVHQVYKRKAVCIAEG